jgi:catechol 2,3-dioxygenase-like lactoylglutathione lyase family enzyme
VLDHVALEVSDLPRAARFYDALMRPLGGRRIVDSPHGIGYGRDRPELWLMPRSRNSNGTGTRTGDPAGDAEAPAAATRPTRGHFAIAAAGRRAVDAAHQAGLAAGGRDGGAPAPRPFGPPGCYSAYLLDPDGAWLELVSGTR